MAASRRSSSNDSDYGRLADDEPIQSRPKGLPSDVDIRPVKWVPDRRRMKGLLRDFKLRLLIVEEPNGFRRIFPRGTDQDFLVAASAGGLSLLFALKEPTPDVRETYRLMHLIFQGSFNPRRMMTRRFTKLESVSLRGAERPGPSVRDVLPEIVLPGTLARLTPNSLYQLGLQSAKKSGVPKLNPAKIIEAALLEAARQTVDGNSNLTAKLISEDLLRIALFGMDSGEPPSKEEAAELGSIIEGRVFDAVRKHRKASARAFEKFLWTDVDNLVQQLSKRKPPISRSVTYYLLSQLLWRSFTYVSQCISLQMQAVRLAVHPSLGDEERRVYGHRYEIQDHLGGIVAAALNPRLGFVCQSLDRLSDCEVDDEAAEWGALKLALIWHNSMVEARREADRRQKGLKWNSKGQTADDRKALQAGGSREKRTSPPRLSEVLRQFDEIDDAIDAEDSFGD